MVITEHGERDQIAVVEDNVLVEHYITRVGAQAAVLAVLAGTLILFVIFFDIDLAGGLPRAICDLATGFGGDSGSPPSTAAYQPIPSGRSPSNTWPADS